MTYIQAALDLAEDGWAVFPVGPDKRPLCKWREVATSDPKVITELWSQHRNAWPAIALPDSVLVLDVDTKNGGRVPDGLPPTLSVTTQSGGKHLYFYLPEEEIGKVGNLVGLIQGVDSRTEGGYVVAPGAPGYSWDNDLGCEEAPAWLTELCRKRVVDAPTDKVIGELPAEVQAERLPQLLSMFQEAWQDGQKHMAALAIAGYMHKAGFSWESVAAIIEQLPSKNPEDRLRDARDAWERGDQAAGYKWLSEHLPEVWQSALDVLSRSPEPSPLVGLAAPDPVAGPWLTVEDVFSGIPESQDVRYFKTGIAPLDACLMSGAGLYPGRPVILAGAPEAAKTQLAYQIADNFACAGVAVLHVAVDEAPEELIAREIATWQPGVSRVEAATPGPALRETFRARRAAEHTAPYVYQREPRLDAAFLKVPELRKLAPTGTVAVIVDSLHKVDVGQGSDEYDRLEATCNAIRIAMQDARFRCIFIATAELARSSYEDKGKDDTGAGAGHRALEYTAAVQAILRRDGEVGPYGGTVLKLTKNKLGPLARMGLARESADCPRLHTADAPPVHSGPQKRDKVKVTVLRALSELPANADSGEHRKTARVVLMQRVYELHPDMRPGEVNAAVTELQMANAVWCAPGNKAIQITAKGADMLREMTDPYVNAGNVPWPDLTQRPLQGR